MEVSTGDNPKKEALRLTRSEDNLPKKKFFRSRAHCNPLSHNDSFIYPLRPSPDHWRSHYPHIPLECLRPVHLDIGMGFGGLTVALARLYPDKLVLGMEIRAKVCEYVRLRIDGLRQQHERLYQNASCLRTNCMRYLPNYFEQAQLDKIFICFPDPHFKQKNHRRRIVSYTLLSEYAYFLRPGGRLYLITDVEELHRWHVDKVSSHASFRRIDDALLQDDPAYIAMHEETEEGQKVSRNHGQKYAAVYERVDLSDDAAAAACAQTIKQPLDALFHDD
jgi:tRNA (guanine-N7-)-methyltransferase